MSVGLKMNANASSRFVPGFARCLEADFRDQQFKSLWNLGWAVKKDQGALAGNILYPAGNDFLPFSELNYPFEVDHLAASGAPLFRI
jgi:hypothetical protein